MFITPLFKYTFVIDISFEHLQKKNNNHWKTNQFNAYIYIITVGDLIPCCYKSATGSHDPSIINQNNIWPNLILHFLQQKKHKKKPLNTPTPQVL